MARAKQVNCPVCEERFDIEPDLAVGDVTSCPSCYVDLKILSLSPVEVEEAELGLVSEDVIDDEDDDSLIDDEENPLDAADDDDRDDFGRYR